MYELSSLHNPNPCKRKQHACLIAACAIKHILKLFNLKIFTLLLLNLETSMISSTKVVQ